jgi:hypothetical protein
VELFNHEIESIDIGPALFRWKNEKKGGTAPNLADAGTYLKTLLNECSSIEIKGFKVSDAKTHRLDIEQLYTPLHITGSMDDIRKEPDKKGGLEHRSG